MFDIKPGLKRSTLFTGKEFRYGYAASKFAQELNEVLRPIMEKMIWQQRWNPREIGYIAQQVVNDITLEYLLNIEDKEYDEWA